MKITASFYTKDSNLVENDGRTGSDTGLFFLKQIPYLIL